MDMKQIDAKIKEIQRLIQFEKAIEISKDTYPQEVNSSAFVCSNVSEYE